MVRAVFGERFPNVLFFFSHRARTERDSFHLVIDVKIKLKICYSWATLAAAADSSAVGHDKT